MPQSLAERETHLNMTADNRDEWAVFTDDPVWISRLEKLGFQSVKDTGEGKEFVPTADQVVIRKGKRHISDSERERRRLAAQTSGFGPRRTQPSRTETP